MKAARALVVVSALGLLASCGTVADQSAAPDAHEIALERAGPDAIRIESHEYGFTIGNTRVPAGQVDIVLANQGKWAHEAVVVPLDGDRYGLPVAEVESVAAGESGAARVTLTPGRYIIVCLLAASRDGEVVSHWSQGMEAEFEVTAS